MKVCVFGGCGFLGDDLVKYLKTSCQDIIVCDLHDTREFSSMEGVTFHQVDLQEPDTYRKIVGECDTLCMYASTSRPGLNDERPIDEFTNEILFYARLLEEIKSLDVKKIIFLSSGGAVYGPSPNMLLSESHPTRPSSAYGVGKLAIELLIERYAAISNWSYTIFRPANPVGADQFKLVNRHGLVATVLYNLAEDRPISIWGDGTIVRDYFDVSDLSNAVMLAIEKPEAENQILNVGSGIGLSIRQVIELCERLTGRTASIEQLPHRVFDVPYNLLDTSKIKTLLEWELKVPLDQTVARMWQVLQ